MEKTLEEKLIENNKQDLTKIVVGSLIENSISFRMTPNKKYNDLDFQLIYQDQSEIEKFVDEIKKQTKSYNLSFVENDKNFIEQISIYNQKKEEKINILF